MLAYLYMFYLFQRVLLSHELEKNRKEYSEKRANLVFYLRHESRDRFRLVVLKVVLDMLLLLNPVYLIV